MNEATVGRGKAASCVSRMDDLLSQCGTALCKSHFLLGHGRFQGLEVDASCTVPFPVSQFLLPTVKTDYSFQFKPHGLFLSVAECALVAL